MVFVRENPIRMRTGGPISGTPHLCVYNLVGGFSPPLWKIWLRQLGWGKQPNISGKMPNWWQPNHQPENGWKLGGSPHFRKPPVVAPREEDMEIPRATLPSFWTWKKRQSPAVSDFLIVAMLAFWSRTVHNFWTTFREIHMSNAFFWGDAEI